MIPEPRILAAFRMVMLLPRSMARSWASALLKYECFPGVAYLSKRIPHMNKTHISELVSDLNDMRITNLSNLKAMMTGHGAADLRYSITPYTRPVKSVAFAESCYPFRFRPSVWVLFSS